MATPHHPHNIAHTDTHRISQVPMTRPFIWLGKAWTDLLHHPGASLAYGALTTALGGLILVYQHNPIFVAALASGFLLVGPIITAGVCELSRCRDCGEPTDFQTSLKSLGRNRRGLIKVAQTLLLLAILWFALSAVFLQSALGSFAPSLSSTVWGDVMRQVSSAHLGGYILAGGGLSLVVFALSVVTVPMIIDQHVDAGTAMRTSLRVTRRDFPAMLVWAIIITVLVAVGFAAWLVPMILLFPLLGHATWHAYRDLVH